MVKIRKAGPGRPKGSGNKIRLTRDHVLSIQETWEREGVAALDRLAREQPDIFIRLMLTLIPPRDVVRAAMLKEKVLREAGL